MIAFAGAVLAVIFALAVTVLNAYGLSLVSNWVLFQYVGIHFSTAFFLMIALFILSYRREKDTDLSMRDALIKITRQTMVVWLSIATIYFCK